MSKNNLAIGHITPTIAVTQTYFIMSYDPSRQRMHSSAARAGQANNTQCTHSKYIISVWLLGPFHGAIAVPSVTRCRCFLRRGHRCAGGVRQWRRATVAIPGEWQCKTARSGEWGQHFSNASCLSYLILGWLVSPASTPVTASRLVEVIRSAQHTYSRHCHGLHGQLDNPWVGLSWVSNVVRWVLNIWLMAVTVAQIAYTDAEMTIKWRSLVSN